uniref:Ovule protein n=1 Tax=Panagrellus redivivus TaxID=6233 RepID=A0A7E4ZZ38_PANRE
MMGPCNSCIAPGTIRRTNIKGIMISMHLHQDSMQLGQKGIPGFDKNITKSMSAGRSHVFTHQTWKRTIKFQLKHDKSRLAFEVHQAKETTSSFFETVITTFKKTMSDITSQVSKRMYLLKVATMPHKHQ